VQKDSTSSYIKNLSTLLSDVTQFLVLFHTRCNLYSKCWWTFMLRLRPVRALECSPMTIDGL
jgi:hypothetical protein